MGEANSNRVKGALKKLTQDYMLVIAIIILGGVFAIASPYFMTVANIRNIFWQTASLSIVAIGQAVVLICGYFDMSLGQNVCFVTILGAVLMVDKGWNPYVTILFILIVGAGIGLVNGVLVAYLNVPAFVATLGTQMVCKGCAKMLTNATPVPNLPDSIAWIGRSSLGGKQGLPYCIIIMLVLYAMFAFILRRTRFGRETYEVGGNSEAAYFAGINVKKHITAVFTLAGFMAALGGTLLMSRLNTGAITNGNLYEFDTMIACVIGGVSMTGGKGKIWQAFFGAIFLMEFFNGMNMMNVNSFMQDALKGIILVGAVLLDIARNKKR